MVFFTKDPSKKKKKKKKTERKNLHVNGTSDFEAL